MAVSDLMKNVQIAAKDAGMTIWQDRGKGLGVVRQTLQAQLQDQEQAH